MIKKFTRIAAIAAAALALTACGERVEVTPGSVARIIGESGYKDGIIQPSRFRMDSCLIVACDRLVTLGVSDFSITEPMNMMMPKDKLEMKFDLRMTISTDEKSQEFLFAKVKPTPAEGSNTTLIIDRKEGYDTYVQPIVLAETREFLSKYMIADVMASIEEINAGLTAHLTKRIAESTPLTIRYVAIVNPEYPPLIVKAQEAAAERREQINQEKASLDLARVRFQREQEENDLNRKLSIQRTQAEVEVNRLMSSMMTPEYREMRRLQVLEALAKSPNKAIVPMGMLDSLGAQRLATQ